MAVLPTHTFTKRASGGGIAAAVIIVLLIIGAIAAFFFWQKRRSNRSQSANYPAPAPTGLKDWVTDKFRSISRGRNRQQGAGYEPSSRGFFSGGGFSGGGGSGGGRTRGHALDPDEAWDTHVGNEAFLDEQELGLHAPTTYTGAGYGGPGGYAGIGGVAPPGYDGEEERSREIDRRYEEEMHGGSARGGSGRANPFGDEHAVGGGSSLRGVSPRPIDTGRANRGNQQSHEVDSPTERKSAFREEM